MVSWRAPINPSSFFSTKQIEVRMTEACSKTLQSKNGSVLFCIFQLFYQYILDLDLYLDLYFIDLVYKVFSLTCLLSL